MTSTKVVIGSDIGWILAIRCHQGIFSVLVFSRLVSTNLDAKLKWTPPNGRHNRRPIMQLIKMQSTRLGESEWQFLPTGLPPTKHSRIGILQSKLQYAFPMRAPSREFPHQIPQSLSLYNRIVKRTSLSWKPPLCLVMWFRQRESVVGRVPMLYCLTLGCWSCRVCHHVRIAVHTSFIAKRQVFVAHRAKFRSLGLCYQMLWLLWSPGMGVTRRVSIR